MTRFSSISFNVLMALAATFAFVSQTGEAVPSATHPEASELAREGSPEILFGTFSGHNSTSINPTAFVWSRDVAGTQVETWALFRPNASDGWIFPGSNNTSVDIRLDYEGSPTHASLEDFLQWCEDQYPSSMNVDKDVDFEVHEHTVAVLQS